MARFLHESKNVNLVVHVKFVFDVFPSIWRSSLLFLWSSRQSTLPKVGILCYVGAGCLVRFVKKPHKEILLQIAPNKTVACRQNWKAGIRLLWFRRCSVIEHMRSCEATNSFHRGLFLFTLKGQTRSFQLQSQFWAMEIEGIEGNVYYY